MQILKKIGLAVLSCAFVFTALCMAAFIFVQYFMDLNKYKAPIIQTIEKETGFKLSCENIEFKKRLGPYLNIHLYHIGVLYPDNTKFLQIKNSYLHLKILPLLFKKIEIKDVKIERPIVNITLYKNFSNSIEKFINNKEFKPSGKIIKIDLLNYKIKFKDDTTKQTFYLEGDELCFNEQNSDIKINARFYTSDTDSAKIQGKLKLGKKRNIDLNINTVNMDLENLFKITLSSLKFLKVNNPLNGITAKGLLNADFNIKSDFKQIKSKGKAEVINADFTYNSLKYPVTNVNAKINFDNNEIKIEKAQGYISKTPINIQGTIKSNLTANLKAFSENLDIKTLVAAFYTKKELPVEIKKGVLGFKAQINGILGKILKTQAEIYLKDLYLLEKNSKISLKIPQLNLNTNDRNIDIQKSIIKVINSLFIIDGTVTNYQTTPILKINFEGDFISNDIASLISKYLNSPYKAQGKLNTKGNIEFENEKLKLKTQIKANKDNYISYIVIKELLNKPSETNIYIESDKNILTVKDISLAGDKESYIKINGQMENFNNRPEFKNVNFIVPNTVTIASNFFGGEEISLQSDLILNKSIKSPEIKGNITLYKYNLKKYLTSIKNADISFIPNNIRISAPDVIINNSSLNITMDILPDLRNITVQNLQLNSANLDLNSIFPLIKDLQQNKSNITVKKGSAAINNLKLLDLKANDIVSDFKIEKNIVKMYNINASAYSGAVTGKADYEISTGILDIDMSGKNLDIKNSMYDLCRFDDNISGRTDINANVSMLTGSYNTAVKTLSGSMEFNARNGNMGTLGKFEYYLYAKNLLYHGLINTTLNRLVQTIAHDDTTHFNYANGKVFFQNGYIITDGINTRGDKMSLYIKGRHNMLTNTSNLDIYGRISDEITRKMGSFADVSISELINGQATPKNNSAIFVPETITTKIEPLIFEKQKSNMFKVNAIGNIKALNAINSFSWILPEPTKNLETEEEKLPDFSDL